MHVWVLSLDLHDSGMVHVVIMIVRNDNSVHGWDFIYLAGNFGVPLRAQPSEWTAPLAEDRIEEYTEALRKLNQVASVT